jgi:hypothetical protein
MINKTGKWAKKRGGAAEKNHSGRGLVQAVMKLGTG